MHSKPKEIAGEKQEKSAEAGTEQKLSKGFSKEDV